MNYEVVTQIGLNTPGEKEPAEADSYEVDGSGRLHFYVNVPYSTHLLKLVRTYASNAWWKVWEVS